MTSMVRLMSAATLAASLASPLLADGRLAEIAAGDHRPAEWSERNASRHPVETLTFFAIQPDQTVIELSPGGGWYTSILAPYLKDEGRYVAAHWDMEQDDLPAYAVRGYAAFTERFGDQELYGDFDIIPFSPPAKASLGESGSADLVLSFRNVHGWHRDGILADVFESVHEVLKRGGVFGVVGHRLPEDRDGEQFTGYLKQSFIVGMAESHGFRLAEASDINANPKDTADHPNGVWTLPPNSRVPEGEDEERYLQIGESDRFTLKFVKR